MGVFFTCGAPMGGTCASPEYCNGHNLCKYLNDKLNEKLTKTAYRFMPQGSQVNSGILTSSPKLCSCDDKIDFRLGEDKILKELTTYIGKTYSQHYAKDKKRQTIEGIYDAGHGKGFCVGSIMKYVERYGKKQGENRDDLMKAAHYVILALIDHDRRHEEDKNG